MMDSMVIAEPLASTTSVVLRGISDSVNIPHAGGWKLIWVGNDGKYLDFPAKRNLFR